MPEVTAIICTMAEEKRKNSLLSAIDSLSKASINPVKIVVVVNGDRRSQSVINELNGRQGIKVLSLDEASLPAAILVGRRSVDTPFYCFLDDDDEYLPGAIDLRLKAIEVDDKFDFVVSNGFRCIGKDDQTCLYHLDQALFSPLKALFKENWLASCGALFRSDRISAEYFENLHPYIEWTWLAYKLSLDEKKFFVLNVPTFRIHDTPGSASKSPNHFSAAHSLYRRMLDRNPPSEILRIIRKCIGAQYHADSDFYRKSGFPVKAWRAHLQSLLYPDGWRYLSFSRHLFLMSSRDK